MRYGNRWMVVILMVVVLVVSACARASDATKPAAAAKVESIEGTDLQRVVLTEKAAERLDIQTVLVRSEQVARTRTVGGKVMASPVEPALPTTPAPGIRFAAGGASLQAVDPSPIRVQVRLSESDLRKVDRSQSVSVWPLTGDDEEDGDAETALSAEPFDDPDDPEDADPEEGIAPLYYVLNSLNHGLAPGQPVYVQLSLSDNGAERKIVPFAALLYGLNGETWVYTNPEPLVYVRAPVMVDYIDDDEAFLSEGPPVGMEVVTLGGAELFGVESGVGGGH